MGFDGNWPPDHAEFLSVGFRTQFNGLHGEITAIPKPDQTGSSPKSDPVHPTELLATIHHAFGIDPETIVYNHLKQPRELVKARAVTKLFA